MLVTETPPNAGAPPVTTGHDDACCEPEEQIALVYRLHGRSLYRYLLRITLGDRCAAEDLLQETVLRAWRHMQTSLVDAETLRPWLFTVARRLAIDASRARRARPSEVFIDALGTVAAPTDEMDQRVVALTVRQGLMSLSPAHRRILVEIFYHGRTFQEAADALGIPMGTVKSRMFYGLRSLGSILGEGK
jgi:RNA polymerase sigma-70 factor, ECF subfamily